MCCPRFAVKAIEVKKTVHINMRSENAKPKENYSYFCHRNDNPLSFSNENPVIVLHKLAQKSRTTLTYSDPDFSGPPHNRIFSISACYGDVRHSKGTARKKKLAKREAAVIVLIHLQKEVQTFHERIVSLCHEKFTEVTAQIPYNLSGKKVVAGIVMENKTTRELTVVSVASGNRFITLHSLRADGTVLIDSHAEILANRGLRRFLFNCLTMLHEGKKTDIMEKHGKKCRIAKDVAFHLYISKPPCGDLTYFTQSEFGSSPKNITSSSRCQGQVRVQGELQSSRHKSIYGERPRIMLCSHKTSKWNLLGIQGALLANFIHPVYLESIILGNSFNLLSHTMRCRLDRKRHGENLPGGYRAHHPTLGVVPGPLYHGKWTDNCINWNNVDNDTELTNSNTGLLTYRNAIGIENPMESRLCKRSLLQHYKHLCAIACVPKLKPDYLETKMSSTKYQKCKKVFKDTLSRRGFGTWAGLREEYQKFPTDR